MQREFTLLLKKFPQNAFKSFICRQENAAAVRPLRAKIVMRSLAAVKKVKNHHFSVQLSHCFSTY